MSHILVLPHIRILNANAHSSPYTVGFPAMTAWLGAMHFLQREISQQENFGSLTCEGIGVVCHDFSMHSYRGKESYVSSLIGTSNPLDRNGKRPSFIEEAKCSLEVSLLIQIGGLDLLYREKLTEYADHLLRGRMKIASGDLISLGTPRFENTDEASFSKLMNSLMPGYVLIERRDLMVEAMQNEPQSDAMDALLAHLTVYNVCRDGDDEITWTRKRMAKGWILPIGVGYQAITDFIESDSQRDASTAHRFVESIVTLGEFKMAYRMKALNDVLWHYHVSHDNAIYVCVNNKNSGR